MTNRYRAWISTYLSRVGDPLQQCEAATLEMQQAFPKLRRVRGTVRMLAAPDGDTSAWPHWWLVDQDEHIVDPTASQFPGPLDYFEMDEDDPIVGRCHNCGEYFTRSQACQGCCSRACATEYGSYLNSFRHTRE